MDEAIEILAGRKAGKPNLAVLTFDDGYRNNITYGLPILTKLNIPATIYVSSGHVKSQKPFWFDRLDYVLQQLSGQRTKITIAGRSFTIDSSNREQLGRSFRVIREELKSKFTDDLAMNEEANRVAAVLEGSSGRNLAEFCGEDPWSAILTAEEISEAANAQGTGFGGHTVDHIRLSKVDEETVNKELHDNKKDLERWTDKPVQHFAYPDGSHSQAVERAVERCGYRSAVTSDPGFNGVGCNLYRLKRLHMPFDASATEILAIASGLSAWLEACTKSVRGLIRSVFPGNTTRS